MAHHRIGSQRRVYLCDVLEFARRRDKEYLVALDMLARVSFCLNDLIESWWK
jgi:hypothetical protein